MPFAETGHLKTFYQDIGKSDQVLLLLHGWGNSWESWAPLIPVLSVQYRLIIPDLPGFGKSDSPHGGWNMAQYSRWLDSFLDEVLPKKPPIVGVLGHSFGGKLAAFAWAAYAPTLKLPEISTGIFLIDPSGITPKKPLLTTLSTQIIQRIPRSVKQNSLAQLRQWWYLSVLKEEDYYSATPFQAETLRKILHQDIRHSISQPSEIPFHILWGEKDEAVEAWMAYQYRPLSQNADVYIVPDAEHFPHHTHTELTQKWLETWL